MYGKLYLEVTMNNSVFMTKWQSLKNLSEVVAEKIYGYHFLKNNNNMVYMFYIPSNSMTFHDCFNASFQFSMTLSIASNSKIFLTTVRASDRSQKKSRISWDFQRQICGKIGWFRKSFAEIFRACFPEKQLVKNSRLRGNFLGKISEKLIDFVLIWWACLMFF